MKNKQLFLTVRDVAQRWRCDQRTIYKLIHCRRLHAMRVGHVWRIPLAAMREAEISGVMHEQADAA